MRANELQNGYLGSFGIATSQTCQVASVELELCNPQILCEPRCKRLQCASPDVQPLLDGPPFFEEGEAAWDHACHLKMRPAPALAYPGGMAKSVGGAVQQVPLHHSGAQPVTTFRSGKQVFRVQVLNVPSYLRPEEFRSQFTTSDGLVSASVGKDQSGCVPEAAECCSSRRPPS